MAQHNLVLVIGPEGSKKTRWCQGMVKNKPNSVRICPEEIEKMAILGRATTDSDLEALSVGIESLIMSFLSKGYIVFFESKYLLHHNILYHFVQEYQQFGKVEYKIFGETVEMLCKEAAILEEKGLLKFSPSDIYVQHQKLQLIKPMLSSLQRSGILSDFTNDIVKQSIWGENGLD